MCSDQCISLQRAALLQVGPRVAEPSGPANAQPAPAQQAAEVQQRNTAAGSSNTPELCNDATGQSSTLFMHVMLAWPLRRHVTHMTAMIAHACQCGRLHQQPVRILSCTCNQSLVLCGFFSHNCYLAETCMLQFARLRCTQLTCSAHPIKQK